MIYVALLLGYVVLVVAIGKLLKRRSADVRRHNRMLVAAAVAITIAASPAVDRVYVPRPDPPIHMTAVHVHQLRTLLNEWGA